MRKKNTELIRDVLGRYIKEVKLDVQLYEKRLIDAWPIVLGSNILQYTSDLKIKNKTLYVTLTSSVLRQDLFMSRMQIVSSLNAQVGCDVINDIVFL